MNCIDLTSKRSKLLSYVAKQQNDQIIVHCIDFTSKRSKTLMYIAKHSKQRKTTKVIKLQWIASIWCQKDQTNAKLQKWYYFDEFGLIWRQNDQNVWVRSQHYKINQIPMDCIDLTSKQSKMLRYVAKHSKLRKTTKVIKLQWIASIWCQKDQTNANYKSDWLIWIDLTSKRSKQRKTTESDQITMNCIDLTSKQSKMWRYVAKLQKWSNYNELHRFDVKKIKPTQNYKSDQIIMNCIDLTSKRSKLLSYVAKQQNDQIIVHCIDFTSKRSKTLRYIAKHSKQRKTTKVQITMDCIDLTKTMNLKTYDQIIMKHRFDVKTIKTKTYKTTNSHCIKSTINLRYGKTFRKTTKVKTMIAKQRKTTKVIKL